MKKLICLFILTQSLFVFGQEKKVYKFDDIAILQADSLVSGFYLTYDDFLNNNPSKQGLIFGNDLLFYKKDGGFLSKKKQKLYFYYKPQKKERVKYNRLKFKMWGYNDGKTAYIYHNKRYSKIHEFGRYCVFTWDLHAIYYGQNPKTTPYVQDVDKDYVLDILTGDTFRLNAKNIKKYLLSDDPKLMEEFKNETRKKIMYYYYVNEVNKKYSTIKKSKTAELIQ